MCQRDETVFFAVGLVMSCKMKRKNATRPSTVLAFSLIIAVIGASTEGHNMSVENRDEYEDAQEFMEAVGDMGETLNTLAGASDPVKGRTMLKSLSKVLGKAAGVIGALSPAVAIFNVFFQDDIQAVLLKQFAETNRKIDAVSAQISAQTEEIRLEIREVQLEEQVATLKTYLGFYNQFAENITAPRYREKLINYDEEDHYNGITETCVEMSNSISSYLEAESV